MRQSMKKEIDKCPTCGCGLSKSVQKREGVLRPDTGNIKTCCNPACSIEVNVITGENYLKVIKKDQRK